MTSPPCMQPMLLRMAAELEGNEVGTLREHMIQQAEEGVHMLLVGQLAAVVAAATRHLFAPDLRFERIEHSKNVLVRGAHVGAVEGEVLLVCHLGASCIRPCECAVEGC